MRLAASSSAFFVGALTAQSAVAEAIPKFDETDFEIIFVLPSSDVLARSDGRDFLCSVSKRLDSGYLLLDFCVPYVGSTEAREQEELLAPMRERVALAQVEGAKRALEQKQREEEEARKAREARLKKFADEKVARLREIEERKGGVAENEADEASRRAYEKEFKQRLNDVPQNRVTDSLRSALRAQGCEIAIGSRKFTDPTGLAAVWAGLGMQGNFGEIDPALIDVFRKRVIESMRELYRVGELEYLDELTKIKLKDCN